MTAVLVHVGLHKTGTTFLQKFVFPNLVGAEMLGGEDARELQRQIRDAAPSSYREDWVIGLGKALSQRPSAVVISSEAFSASLWNDPVGTGLRGAERLHDLGGDTHILLVIRRQDSMLKSIYAQYINEGGALDPARFVKSAEAGKVYELRHLQYHLLLDRYREIFQEERVHLLPYEQFRERGVELIDQVLDAAFGPSVHSRGSQVQQAANASLDGASLRLLRIINSNFRRSPLSPHPRIHVRGAARARRLLQRHGSWLSRVGTSPSPWPYVPEETRSKIEASNERLVPLVPQLSELGYLDLPRVRPGTRAQAGPSG